MENIWIFSGSKEKYIEFIERIVKNNIRKIVFVANKNEETFYNIIDKEYIIKNDIRTFVIKNYIDGENIIEKSKYRVEPDCKTYKTCGGCSLRHIDYRETLVIKRVKI